MFTIIKFMTNDMKTILATLFISTMICLIAESCRDNSNKDDETLVQPQAHQHSSEIQLLPLFLQINLMGIR